MKTFISTLAFLLTFNIFAATTAVDSNAKEIKISDMKLTKVVLTKTPYQTYCVEDKRRVKCTQYKYTYQTIVNVSLSYRVKGEFCRPKRDEEICWMKLITKYTSIQLEKDIFDSNEIETLEARKFYSSKKKYVALANSILNVEVIDQQNAKIISIDLK